MTTISMFAGDTKRLRVTVQDQLGNPVDITGNTIRWQMAKAPQAPPLIMKETGSGIEIVDTNVFIVDLDNPDTETIPPTTYYHEAELNDAGIISTILTGSMRIKPALIKTT